MHDTNDSADAGSVGTTAGTRAETEPPPGLDQLLQHILEQRGFDFTGYKPASLARRIERRMSTVGIATYEEYLDALQVRPGEFTELLNTILINVTGFFRDVEAWQHLQTKLLPEILARREGQPVRVWSAGCASGEEAYTLAMVLAELMGVDDFRGRVKIYATDIDEEALARARQASYTARDLEAVPAELRERYFDPLDGRFVFRKELRRSVIFGRNDLVQDAPISHVDLLASRNTLMYFNSETQAQILARMHFALRPEGILFLGKAEMLPSHSALFRPLELRRRFFLKVPTEVRERRVPTSLTGPVSLAEDDLEVAQLRQAALMSTAAAQLVLDTDARLVLANHRAMNLFGLTARDVGRPFQDLEVSYRPVELRGHLQQSTSERRVVWVRDVEKPRDGGDPLSLDVQLVPLTRDTGQVIGTTVIFNDVTQYRQLQRELVYSNRQLETAYEELQSTNEELETTNEELQSTVEELETTNEELQSTNEELETMNEELQSMNDQLQISNDALRGRQDELDRLNRFMSAVLGSMSSGVVVVDQDLTVLAWNNRAEDQWGLRRDEVVGEHLMNLDIGLPVEQLRQPLRARTASPGNGAGHGTADRADRLLLDAVNRRGRHVRVQVTITPLDDHGDAVPAAMIVMDDVE